MHANTAHQEQTDMQHTDRRGVALREGIIAETKEVAGLAHVGIPHHQHLEDIVRLATQCLDKLQRLQKVKIFYERVYKQVAQAS